MSYDRDLSGSDLKIIEYTIATSAPYIPDKDRILTDCPRVIAISEDLSESAFVAMVVAKNCKHIDKEERDEKWDPRYLLVSYNVLARQSIDTVYERDQVKALRDIKHILKKKEKDEGGNGRQ